MPNVDIPDVGVVEFPESMAQADINAAAKKLYDQAHGPQDVSMGSAINRALSQIPVMGPGGNMLRARPQDALTALPFLGAALGEAGGPVGVGLGAASGRGLQRAGMEALGLNEPQSPGQAALDVGLTGLAAGGLSAIPGAYSTAKAAIGSKAAQGAAAKALSRYLAHETPLIGKAMRTAELIKTLKALGASGEEAAAAVGSLEARAAQAARATARTEGKTIIEAHPRSLPKPRRGPEVGSAASRSQRGASKPELARRAKDLERAKARRAPKVQELEDKTGKVIAKIVPAKETGSAASRHQVQYFSESAKKYVDIEKMNQKHIESAFRKLSAKNPKPGSVGRRVLDALLEESKHRLKTTGIHIGQ